jgi:CRISPR-associated protein Cas1
LNSDTPQPQGGSSTVEPAVPDLVPARMVNEFCYCPRLFYLEWAQGLFEHNADTVEGAFRHRAVDRQEGRMPLPSEIADLRRATSVTVGSVRLGAIAVIDLIAADNGSVIPVDTKKGAPPPQADGWEPDMIQLCLQGLLLRDNGYSCEQGILYYATTRERRTIIFDEQLVTTTLHTLEQLRVVAAQPNPPPPLVDSPKCPRCSLVGICLPDETNLLSERSAQPPRRLVPRDDSARPLYVTEQGAYVGLHEGRIEITRHRELIGATRLIDVSQVNLTGNVQISTQLLRECFRREIPVAWFSYGGWFSGIAEGLPNKHVELRRRQVGIAHQAGVPLAAAFIEGKIRNSRTLLRRNTRARHEVTLDSLKRLAEQAARAATIESLLGIEGAAARLYFRDFPTMLRKDFGFDFTGRNRRPPKDPVNCLLSFLYGLLVKDLTAVVYTVGFDPYIGFLHRPRFGRPALALDLAEEFRPLVADSVAINVLNNRELDENDFIIRAAGVALTVDGRRSVLAAYERRLDTEIRHPVFGYKITYRRVFEVQARLLAAAVLGEVPSYTPFVTR